MALVLFSACRQPAKPVPCTGDTTLRPFKQRDTVTIDSSGLKVLNKLKSTYGIMQFDSAKGKEMMLMSNAEGFTIWHSRRFDTISLVNHIPTGDKRHILKCGNKYILHDGNVKMGCMIANIFDGQLQGKDSFAVEQRADKDKYYIANRFGTKLIATANVKTFLLNYGTNKQENVNFLDKNIFQYSLQGAVKKIGVYPAGYNKTYKEVRDAFFDIDSNNTIYYALAYSDSVYKMDINGIYRGAARIAECRQFDPYGNSDVADLAYKRKYLYTSEQNLVLELVNNKYIVVLRRKSRQQMKDMPAYLVTVFNLQLDKLYQEELKADITPAIFHSGNTIFFLAMDFSKTYGYEIK